MTTATFQIFMQQPDNEGHVNDETASYIVMEKGRHTLEGGLVAEAGSVITDSVHQAPNAGGGEVITFTTPFSNTPAVLHTLNTPTTILCPRWPTTSSRPALISNKKWPR